MSPGLSQLPRSPVARLTSGLVRPPRPAQCRDHGPRRPARRLVPVPPRVLQSPRRWSRLARSSPSSQSGAARKPPNHPNVLGRPPRRQHVRRPRRQHALPPGHGQPHQVLPHHAQVPQPRRRAPAPQVRHPSPARDQLPRPPVSGLARRLRVRADPARRGPATIRSRQPKEWGKPDVRRAAHLAVQLRELPAVARRARTVAPPAPNSGCLGRGVLGGCRVPTRR